MPRLPGQVAAISSVDTARAQSTPLRSTTAPHIDLPWFSPPASPFCAGAACSKRLRSAAPGTSEHPLDRGGLGVVAGSVALRTSGDVFRLQAPQPNSNTDTTPAVRQPRIGSS